MILCPCGTSFTPHVSKDIQLLCDDCAIYHFMGHGELAPCWVGESNVISLFRSATGRALPVAEGIASGGVGGEVGVVTPVPLLHPLSPGARRG